MILCLHNLLDLVTQFHHFFNVLDNIDMHYFHFQFKQLEFSIIIINVAVTIYYILLHWYIYLPNEDNCRKHF